MRYRIAHVSTHHTNIGDGALNSAIQHSLKAELPEVTFDDQDLMEFSNYFGSREFDRDYVEHINTHSDMLIVGGGGMIDGTGAHRASGLGFNLEPELLREITVPVVFYALGFNLFPGQRFEHLDRLRETLRVVETMPNALFSVRFDDSLHRLRNMTGMPLESVLEVPDPDFFVEPTDCHHIELDSDRKNVVLQLAGDRLRERLGLPPFLGSVGPYGSQTRAAVSPRNLSQLETSLGRARRKLYFVPASGTASFFDRRFHWRMQKVLRTVSHRSEPDSAGNGESRRILRSVSKGGRRCGHARSFVAMRGGPRYASYLPGLARQGPRLYAAGGTECVFD